MKKNNLVAVCGTLLTLAGSVLVLRGGAPEVMEFFGSSASPPAASGEPAWIGVAFMRAFGAATLALGLVMIGASRLSGEAARVLGAPLAFGLGILGLVTSLQAQAIWSTPGAWFLVALIGVACLVVAWPPTERGAVAR